MSDRAQGDDADDLADILDLITRTKTLENSFDVLNSLHEITSKKFRINVLGAVRLPEQFGVFEAVVDRKTVFLHKSVPAGWWDAYTAKSQKHPSPIYAMAQLRLEPFTTTETMQRLDPIGADRWSFELSQEYGMRDSLACPVGGRWVFAYWSSDVMTNRLSPNLRAILFLVATYAVMRLEELMPHGADELNVSAKLTPRELAVLFALSRGKRVADAALELSIGEESVRTHIKKAQAKLNAKTQTFAVAKAIRQRLIP